MAVSTIALYASPPSSVCSTPYPCSINSHSSSSSSSSYDFDLNGRSPSTSSQSPSSTSQRSIMGGLSCLLKHSSPCSSNEEFQKLSVDDHHHYQHHSHQLSNLSSSFRYSNCSQMSSSLKRDQSPVSVLQGPRPVSASASVSGSCNSVVTGSFSGYRMNGTTGVLLNGFVRSSLGSCLDRDVEELTFNMEDHFVFGDGVEELLANAQLRNEIFYDDFVIKAFYDAEKAHRGQVRASGHPYLQHCVETAVLLASIGANTTVVAAGLLHDTIDDSFLTYDYIYSNFGSGVADLVLGVSKLSHLSKLARENNTANKTLEADRLHTMFLAMADARAVLIKLADRLHNMMTLDALPSHKQLRFAKETLEIFVPLANRLGVSTLKEQLENLCFKHLYPNQHDELSSKRMKLFDQAMIKSATRKLEEALKAEDIVYHDLSGRHKSLYSIHRKMSKKNLTMDQIHDIHGLRLIVENEDDCFKALEVVHRLWSEVPGKYKDYIHCPKCNGYQSLHTVVVGEGMVPLEVQIRTREMHLQAEYGFAAHWRYKEGESKHPSFVLQMVEWARWVVNWHCETMNKDKSSLKPPCKFPTHSEGCPYSYNSQPNQDGPVFVILIENDKMSVREFPPNSTLMDLLELTGHGSPRLTSYGFPVKEELRPRLNHLPVNDPTCKLKMGDVIELTPAIPDKSLVEYREEIQRMYNRGLSVSTPVPAPTGASVVGWTS